MIELLIPFLKKIIDSVFPSPEQKLEVEKALSEAMQREAEAKAKEREQISNEFIEIVRSTQPSADRVYVFANTLIALVRPTISLLLVWAMIFRTETVKSLVASFADSGPGGWLVMAPVLWWFFGRDIAKFLGRDGLVAAMTQSAGENNSSSRRSNGRSNREEGKSKEVPPPAEWQGLV